MNVLITGIDGFTGKHLEKFLTEKGHNVFGTIIGESTTSHHLKCDIRNRAEIDLVMAKARPDYVFHLAGISFVGETDRSMIYDVNVLGTQNILDSLLSLAIEPKKIIIASSATVYGNQDKSILDEDICPKPVNHYGCSKLAMEHIAATYFDKLNIVMTRPFNYTGIGHSENFIIPKIVSHFAAKKTSIELGNLEVAREFNDIRTVIAMYYKLMTSDVKSEIINLCTGKVVKLKDVLRYMEHIAGYQINVNVNPAFVRLNEISVLMGSVEKLHSLVDVENKFTIEDTLKMMYEGIEND